MNDNYDDIIGLSHPEPVNRGRMSMMARAAQFAPFAAITGHDAAIAETGRYTSQQIELGEAITQELDRTLASLQDHLHKHPVVQVTHFVPDPRKAGGHYITTTAPVTAIDTTTRTLTLASNIHIPLHTITHLHEMK